jgi:hypothetical protein
METPANVGPKRRWGLLIGLLLFFLGTPWFLYFIATLDGPDWTYALVIPVLLWFYPPAYVFGPRFFQPVQYGYNPLGVAGWLAGVLFYATIATILWAVIRALLSHRRPHNI